MKKTLIIFITITTILLNCISIQAAELSNNAGNENSSMNAYVSSVVNAFLMANSRSADSTSSAVPVIDAETMAIRQYVYFVIKDSSIIGYINVYDNGDYKSNYVNAEVDIEKGDSVSLFYKDEELVLIHQSDVIHLAGEFNCFEYSDYPPSTKTEISDEIYISNCIQTDANPIYYYLSVPYVANSSVDRKFIK